VLVIKCANNVFVYISGFLHVISLQLYIIASQLSVKLIFLLRLLLDSAVYTQYLLHYL